jgi:hypothetical protein
MGTGRWVHGDRFLEHGEVTPEEEVILDEMSLMELDAGEIIQKTPIRMQVQMRKIGAAHQITKMTRQLGLLLLKNKLTELRMVLW